MDAAGKPKLTLLSIYEDCLENALCFKLAFAGGVVEGQQGTDLDFSEDACRKRRTQGRRRKGGSGELVDPSNHIRRKWEDGGGVSGNDSAALPSLSILPRRKNERCGRRTEGVMVKGSDGDKKKERGKKQEMALGGLQKKQGLRDKSRGNVSEKAEWQKKQEKELGREEKEVKGGALMSWVWPWEIWDHPPGLNTLKERCALLFEL